MQLVIMLLHRLLLLISGLREFLVKLLGEKEEHKNEDKEDNQISANVLITPGTGDTVAAEDISSVKYQQVKLIDPTAASTTGHGIAANPFVITVGTAATSLGKARAATPGSTDTGVMSLGLRNDTPATLTETDGKYTPLRVDSTGSLYVTGGGGGTQYADNTAWASGRTGTMALATRHDANTTLATVDGTFSPLQLTAAGSLKVAITSGAGSGGTSQADQAAFTTASTSYTPVGGIYQASADTLVDGTAGVMAIDINRNVKVSLATLLSGEDLTNNVLGVMPKALAASTYSPSTYAPMTQVTKANIKNSTGNVLAFFISNINAAVRYFQLHNKATAPAGTDVPIFSFPVGAGTSTNPIILEMGSEFFTQAGKNFTTGIGWAISTTYATFTDSATAAEHVVSVMYV